MLATVVASIPSPAESVWYLGPLPLRAYAIAIILGIIAATLLSQRRLAARGGDPDAVLDVVFWAVPFGIVGGRIYHVLSSPDAYFGPGGDPVKALAIWEGGLGIWGAIAFGAVGAWIGCRRAGLSFAVFADVLAPALLVAQAIGRLGNWFNQELFGSPTSLPWGLEIDPSLPQFPADLPPETLFHPTFLYELVWNLAAAYLLIRLERRFRWGHGRVFWMYVVLYTSGRLWIEMLRIDDAERVLGVRLNVWTSIIVLLGALLAWWLVGRRHPERETSVLARPAAPSDPAELTSDGSAVPKDTSRSDQIGESPHEGPEP